MTFENLISLYEEAIERHKRPPIDVVLSLLLGEESRQSNLKEHYELNKTDAYTFHKAFRQTDVCEDSFAIWKLMESSDIFFSVFMKNLPNQQVE